MNSGYGDSGYGDFGKSLDLLKYHLYLHHPYA